MEAVFPDVEEIEYRKKNHGVIEDILKENIQCGICKSDLLNDIVTQKIVMVHRSLLILCCHNCFCKLCEGNDVSCFLCKSSIELSYCGKCYLNICKICVKNHNIKQESNGLLSKCFGCAPQILWKLRAQAANVLIIFYSQISVPNGLLVNEIECEQTVKNYLVNEAKLGQNSATDSIKDELCVNFMFNSYKTTIFEELSSFPPTIDKSITIDECSKQFIQICERVLKKTCFALLDFKRLMNINSQLNPGVSAILKYLSKTVDENEKMSVNEENSKMELNNTGASTSLNMLHTRSARPKNEGNCDNSVIESAKSSCDMSGQSLLPKMKDCSVVLTRMDVSHLSKKSDKEPNKNNSMKLRKRKTIQNDKKSENQGSCGAIKNVKISKNRLDAKKKRK